MRILAWCGIVGPLLRLGLIALLGVLHPNYLQSRDFISELGAPDSPFAPLMNYAGTSLVGLLLVLFSVALYRFHRPGALALAGATLLALSGLAFVAVGLFPCDRPGCASADPSATMRVHLLMGMVGMSAQTLAPLAFGLRLFTGTRTGRYDATSLAIGLVALAALVSLFLLVGQHVKLAHPGLPQKIFQVSTDVWVILSAVHVLRRSTPGQ